MEFNSICLGLITCRLCDMAKPPHSVCDPDEIEEVCVHCLSDNGKAQSTTQRSSKAGEKKDYPGTNLLHYKGERAFSPLAKEGSTKSLVLEPKHGVARRGFYTPRRGCRSGFRD